MNESDEELIDRLRAIADPRGTGNIVEQGRVSARRISGRAATIVLDVTGLDAKARDLLEHSVRTTLAEGPDVGDVKIVLTADKIERPIIAVGSGKGGVGKSTVAANLAIALARAGRRVGLIDADIYGPSQPRIMGNEERPEAVDKQIIAVEAHGIRMLSIGQLVDANTALAWRGPMASSALGQLVEGDWGDTDLLVVDLPPGTGDVQLSLLQKWKPAGAIIVSTPQDLALIDARRAIDLFRKMNVPILGLIENMAGYTCPHCGESSDPFGKGGAEAAAADMDLEFLGRIPLRLTIRRASDVGMPPAAGAGEEAEIFAALAANVLEALNRTMT